MINLNILIKHIKDIIVKYPGTIEIKNNNKELKVEFDYGLLYEKWCKFLNKEYSFDITTIDKTNNKDYMSNLKMLLKAKQFLRETYNKN